MIDRFEITEEEYFHWVNTGEVSEDIIKLIAKNLIYKLPLDKYEWEIFGEDTERVYDKIRNYKDEY
tara:strand:- start:109 stop:306 length:198 start_codon:yes stop_codon:yes gene_type:complete